MEAEDFVEEFGVPLIDIKRYKREEYILKSAKVVLQRIFGLKKAGKLK